MIWLTVHMWFLLLLTFAIGLGAGWWIWGAKANNSPATPISDDHVTLGTLNVERTAQKSSDDTSI